MPLTRKTLKAMGLTDEQVESIIDLHTEVTDGLKEKIKATEENKGDAETLKKQLDEANKKLEKAAEYEEKYNAEKKAHDEFKQKIEAAEKKQKQDLLNKFKTKLQELNPTQTIIVRQFLSSQKNKEN